MERLHFVEDSPSISYSAKIASRQISSICLSLSLDSAPLRDSGAVTKIIPTSLSYFQILLLVDVVQYQSPRIDIRKISKHGLKN